MGFAIVDLTKSLVASICTVRPSEDVEITVISGESHGEKVSHLA